jgi:ATP-dependent 26S proteasome regulatory subunit
MLFGVEPADPVTFTGALPGNHLFLAGTTNHINEMDQRVLRGGRFSEKIELGVPDVAIYLKLIPRFLGRTPLADGFEIVELAERDQGHGASGIWKR